MMLPFDPAKLTVAETTEAMGNTRSAWAALEAIYTKVLGPTMEAMYAGKSNHQVPSPIQALMGTWEADGYPIEERAQRLDHAMLGISNLLIVVLNEVRYGLKMLAHMHGEDIMGLDNIGVFIAKILAEFDGHMEWALSIASDATVADTDWNDAADADDADGDGH